MSVTHAATVNDVCHLHAGAQLIGLNLHGKDGDGGGLHIFEHNGGHVGKGARSEIFEDERIEGAAAIFQLRSDGGRNGFGHAVGDERDFLVGLNAQTGEDGGAGAGHKFCGEGLREQVRCG